MFVQLVHREKSLAEEREFMSQQIRSLRDQLNTRGDEVVAARREAGHRIAELQQVGL